MLRKVPFTLKVVFVVSAMWIASIYILLHSIVLKSEVGHLKRDIELLQQIHLHDMKFHEHNETLNGMPDDKDVVNHRNDIIRNKDVGVKRDIESKTYAPAPKVLKSPDVHISSAPGEQGRSVQVIPDKLPKKERVKYDEGWKLHKFNVYASDMISLHRKLPSDVLDPGCSKLKYRANLPEASIIIVFHNEARSTLLRTVHSVLDRSPDHLIKEVILVDDASIHDYLKKPLDDYFSSYRKVKILRAKERSGLVRARMIGLNKMLGKVAVFMDSHCECTDGWLGPLLERIADNGKNVVVPVIDTISKDTFQYTKVPLTSQHIGGFDFDLNFSWKPIPKAELDRRKSVYEPIRSPAFLATCFAVEKNNFIKLGQFDSNFEIWGTENLELSFKIWMCGGMVEIVPCSHVGHVFRDAMPFSWVNRVSKSPMNTLKRNNLRLAEVWMDDYKYIVHDRLYYNLVDFGNVASRKELRQKLKCNDFGWYLKNVYPQLYVPYGSHATGKVTNKVSKTCVESNVIGAAIGKPVILKKCSNNSFSQHWTLTKEGHIRRDDGCLDFDNRYQLIAKKCKDVISTWEYTKEKRLIHSAQKKCLDISADNKQPIVVSCKPDRQTQIWQWELRELKPTST